MAALLLSILVKPSFGGCVSIYIKTGKIVVDGSVSVKKKLIFILSPVSIPASSVATMGHGLPSVADVREHLRRDWR